MDDQQRRATSREMCAAWKRVQADTITAAWMTQAGVWGHSSASLCVLSWQEPLECELQCQGSGRRRGVTFDSVQVREYKPLLGGGGGVPAQGSPLGMGWEVREYLLVDPILT